MYLSQMNVFFFVVFFFPSYQHFSVFFSRLKTHLFHKIAQSSSLSASIRTAFTDLGLGPDLLDTGILFVFVSSFLYIFVFGNWLRVLDTLTAVHIKLPYRIV